MLGALGLQRLDVRFDFLELFADTAGGPPPRAQIIVAVADSAGQSAITGLHARLLAVDGVHEVFAPKPPPELKKLKSARRRELIDRAWGSRADAGWTAFLVELQRDAKAVAVVGEVRAATASLPSDADVLVVGSPVMSVAHAEAARAEQIRLVPVLLIVFTGLLLLSFRGVWGVLLPLGAVSASALMVMGMLGWMGIPLGGPTLLLAPLVIILGMADSIHLLRRYAIEAETQPVGAMDRALSAVGSACVLTTVTTALGFAALTASGSPLLRQFGMLAAAGMGIALIAGLGVPAAAVQLGGLSIRTRSVRISLASLGSRLPAGPTLGVLIVVLLVTTGLSVGIRTDIRLGGELPDDDPVVRDHQRFDAELGGLYTLTLRAKTERWKRPEVLGELLTLQETLQKHETVGSAVSSATALRWVARAIGQSPQAIVKPRRGPTRRQSMKRFDKQAERVKALGETVSPVPLLLEDRNTFLVWTRLHDVGAREWSSLFDDIDAIELEHLELSKEGYAVVAVGAWEQIGTDLARVLLLTFGVTLVCLLIAFRSVRDAVAVVFPLTLTVSTMLAAMAVAGIPLRYPNLFILTAALGLGVDAWIHLVQRRREHGWGAAMQHAAPAVAWSVLLIVAGLLALTTSPLGTVREIGGVLALAMVVNLVGTIGTFAVLRD